MVMNAMENVNLRESDWTYCDFLELPHQIKEIIVSEKLALLNPLGVVGNLN